MQLRFRWRGAVEEHSVAPSGRESFKSYNAHKHCETIEELEATTQHENLHFDTMHPDESDQIQERVFVDRRRSYERKYTFFEAPAWTRDNDYIHNHYRGSMSLISCLKSAFQIHNETLNVCSHLVGTLVFFGLALHTIRWLWDHEPRHTRVVVGYCVAAMTCLTLSTIFHVFYCHSERAYSILVKLDYTGIGIMVVGSILPVIHYSFECIPFWRDFYTGFICILAPICIGCSVLPGMEQNRYRPLRTFLFMTLSSAGVMPFVHKTMVYGLSSTEGAMSLALPSVIVMSTFYTCGAVCYVARIPEKWKPGGFDLLFSSHQLFHLFVVAAALVHYSSVQQVLLHRLSHPCPAA